jgi:hypothetical protein
MTIKEIITGIKTNIESVLPAILERLGLPPIVYYGIGYPFDQDKLSVCVRLTSFEFAGDLIFIIHLSLPHVAEEAAYDYLQAMQDYLNNFDTASFGYYAGTYILEMYENDFNRGDIQALFSITLKKAIDDCDI